MFEKNSNSIIILIEFIPLCGIIKSIINNIEISVNTTLIVGLKLQHVSTLGGHHQVELKNLLITSVFCRIIFHLHCTHGIIKNRLNSGNACYHSVQNLLFPTLLFKYIKNIYIFIYTNKIFLGFILYGCETWSLTLRKKLRMRVFENRQPTRIFWSKRDEVRREWRKLHNEELNLLAPELFF